MIFFFKKIIGKLLKYACLITVIFQSFHERPHYFYLQFTVFVANTYDCSFDMSFIKTVYFIIRHCQNMM